MKKLSVFSLVVGLILAGGGMASVLAQTNYELYAVAKVVIRLRVTFSYDTLIWTGTGSLALMN